MIRDTRVFCPDEKIRHLIRVSLAILPGMFCPEANLFCFERRANGQKIGTSVRYTMICLIGLQRARQAGYDFPFNLDQLCDQVCKVPVPTVADKGLLLWATAHLRKGCLKRIYEQLDQQLSSQIAGLTGMDLGLALVGLLTYASSCESEDAFSSAEKLKTYILMHCLHPQSHLFCHKAGGRFRKYLPNVATQIYLMYGLARYAIVAKDKEAASVAAQCAHTLNGLQRPDGGWPWIYHVSGHVVEDYEIFSVHQDAMMPMALLETGEATSKTYRESLERGLRWLYGENDFQVDMINPTEGIIYRSIRRRLPFNCLMLGLNSICGYVSKRPLFHGAGVGLEVNRTCRPYHPGWILQAWCGREALLGNGG